MDNKDGKKRGGVFGAFAIVAAAAANFKALIIPALKGGSLLKFGWLLKSAATMFISMGLYASLYGWGFAVVVIGLLVLHEFGHWIWMKANNLDPGGPIFLPFIGAFVAMKKLPEDEATRAWVAYAGPLIGGAGAICFYLLGILTNNGLLMAGGCFGFFLNLLQLIPAKPLDGGFVVAAVSKVLLIPGTIIIFALAVMAKSFLLFIIGLLSLGSLLKRRPAGSLSAANGGTAHQMTIGQLEERLVSGPKTDTSDAPAQYSQVAAPTMKPATTKQRWAIGTAYVSLILTLGYLQVTSAAEMRNRLHTQHPMHYLINKDDDQ